MPKPAAPVRALTVLGDEPLQPYQAGVAEQVWTDLTLLEVGQEYAIDPPRQQPSELVLRMLSGCPRHR